MPSLPPQALPALTIFSTEAEVKTLEKVVDEQRRQLEADRDRLENEKRSWERQFEELRGQIAEIVTERRKELRKRTSGPGRQRTGR